MNPPMPPPVMLTIAGSDCSAGAGLQADLKAGLALSTYPLTVLTCAVSEVPGIVEDIIPMSSEFILGQLRLCLAHYPVAAIKAGMLYSPDIVRACAHILQQEPYRHIPLVIDPVMIATAGEPLMLRDAIAAYEDELIARATLLTPNLDEAAALLGCSPITTEEEMRRAAAALHARYGCAILLKGGHLASERCTDLLIHADGSAREWSHPRIPDVSTHGTGCTLSAAVAAGLAHGQPLSQAVQEALVYVECAIAQSLRWTTPCSVQALAAPPIVNKGAQTCE